MPDTPPPASAEVNLVTGLAAFTEHAIRVAELARMDLAVFTATLDRRVYGDERFVAAVRRFALEHRRARLRVLVLEPTRAMQGAHRLVELGRVLSSRIEFRQPDPETPKLPPEDWLIADERALLCRRSAEDLDAQYLPNAPLEARQRLRQFNQFWDHAVPAREFSVLRL